ncbi:FAD/NAD(P)-binding domain-containing protein [Lojkania enalia]|uniref:FAD/NAD(P)-binding domain-containing protein n=1 Tax=Lojkania enalia TaxID=147567 RepID=A0A9P4KGY0_9PLEO|nr:FAD/NAD(P)-binding domain-containing protein [Didymosphaeria enalia]
MPRMKVLISGAGIAGNALAFWLSKLGHDVTVIERFPALRSTGLQIDLRGYGISVLKHMGLEKEFRACAAPEQGMQVVSSSGRRWAYFPANKSGKGMQAFTTEYEIMRGDLCRILYDASRQRANYVFGTSIECFKQSGGAVEVRFVDGSTDQYDLVVGADGLWSKTRKMMLGTGTKDAFHPLEGLYVGYFTMPAPVQEGEEYIATQYLATGGRAIMTRRSSPHALQVYVSCKTDSKELRDTKPGDVREKEILTEKFQGAGWRTDEILKSLNTDNDFYLERMGIVKLENWSNGHLTLVGDAAYCPSANTGMGTTSAFVGAYVLAGEIGRYYEAEARILLLRHPYSIRY